MPKKVAIFGCQAIAIEILRYLNSRSDVEVCKVVTYELPSDISRGQESLITIANELGVPVSSPNRITKELVEELETYDLDLVISAYYRKIFPKRLMSVARLGIVNIHPSLLPNYRGPVPTAWAILNGEREFGVTIHQVDQGIDTGDILIQSKYEIGTDATGYELYAMAMEKGAHLFVKNFDRIIDGEIDPQIQPFGGSYYGKLDNRVLLDWRATALSVKNQVRVRSMPYNPVETLLENKYFFLNRVSIYEGSDIKVQQPGKILKVFEDDRLLVSCADGAVLLEEYTVYPPFTELEKSIYLKEGRSFSH